jgi:hypothetical protein
MANESGRIKPLIITIITRTGYSSINSLPFPPSLLLVVLDLWLSWIYSSCLFMDFMVSAWIYGFLRWFSGISGFRVSSLLCICSSVARRDLQRDFRSFIIITTSMFCSKVGRIHQLLK